MKKNKLNIFVFIILLLSFTIFSCEHEQVVPRNISVWDGTYSIDWYKNNETSSYHYINSASDLAGLAYLVNNNIDNFMGRTIILNVDIDLNGYPWTPIGEGSRLTTGTDGDIQSGQKLAYRFCGYFRGNGHTIENLTNVNPTLGNYIPNPDRCVDGMFTYGLFGLVRHGGIFDLNLENVNIEFINPIFQTFQVEVNGSIEEVEKEFLCDSAGALVGQTRYDFTISNCKVGYNKPGQINSQYNINDSDIGKKAFVISDEFYSVIPNASYSNLNVVPTEGKADIEGTIALEYTGNDINVKYKIVNGDAIPLDINGNEDKNSPYKLSRVRSSSGGLIGRAGSYTPDTLASLTISNSENYNSVEGGVSAGGLIGICSYIDEVTIVNSINAGNVISRENSGGLIGLTSAVAGLNSSVNESIVNTKIITINNCENYGDIMAKTCAGGIAGQLAVESLRINGFTNMASSIDRRRDRDLDFGSELELKVPVRLAPGILVGYLTKLSSDLKINNITSNKYLSTYKYYGRLGTLESDEYKDTSFYKRLPYDDTIDTINNNDIHLNDLTYNEIDAMEINKFLVMRDYIGRIEPEIYDSGIKFFVDSNEIVLAENNNFYIELIGE